MAVTSLDVYNAVAEALSEMPFAAVNDGSTRARQIAGAWVRATESCLAQFPWNFASDIKRLTVDGDYAGDAPYDYAYGYPAGWLRTNYVSFDGRPERRLLQGFQELGGHIFANEACLYISYVHSQHVNSTGLWPRLFANAVGAVIARLISKPVTQSRNTFADLTEVEREMLRQAFEADSFVNPAPPRLPSKLAMAMRGSWR